MTFSYNVIYYNQKEGRTNKTKTSNGAIKMIDEGRKANAKEKINVYWDLMNGAAENNNDELYDYWLSKWAAAREIYELLTGERWK